MDEITESERETIDNLIYLALGDIGLLESVLELSWLQDFISEPERIAIDRLYGLSYEEVSLAASAISLTWIQDDITEIESELIKLLDKIAYYDAEAVASIVAMPFLESFEPDDALAIQGITELARAEDNSLLPALLNHPTLRNGITNDLTTLVAAAGTHWDAGEIRRILSPGTADIEVLSKPESTEGMRRGRSG